MNHLTETQLQALLHGGAAVRAPEAAAHLRSCRACRRRLELYGILAAALQRPPSESLPADFAARTAARVFSRRERRTARVWQKLMPAGALLSGAAGIWLALRPFKGFLDWCARFFTMATGNLFRFDLPVLLPPQVLKVIFLSCAVLLAIGTLDRLIQQRLGRSHRT